MEILAIIPARGGSKSIPDKNIVVVGGKPLIAWTILAARKAASISRIIVTTDSLQIAAVAQDYGAEIPFMRPAELSGDDTPGIDPIIHAADWLSTHQSYHPDYVICLQPTSPFRTAADIDAVVALSQDRDADAVISVVLPEHHPYWMKVIASDGRLRNFLSKDLQVTRRQDAPSIFALNGAIYLVKTDVLLQTSSFYPEKTYAYRMPPERSLDIDTPWDLYLAGLILEDRKSHEHHEDN